MKRMIIGGFLAGFAFLNVYVGYFQGTITGDIIESGVAGISIMFWVGIALLIWGKVSRRRAKKEGEN